MASDKVLTERVRVLLKDKPDFNKKKMFGGVCFLLHGNMACGILNDDLIVRVGPQNYEGLLKLPNIRQFDVTGKPMKGWVVVLAEGHKTKDDLALWVERGATFALTLPAK
ncbi:MAG: TfoX/Sxy family protein [Deltaproteobacteria bacterium]|nr:TfoX/Sxy family protein [Deltaproteobacteria bacterium]